MKTIILSVTLTLLAISGALNWAFATGKLGSSHYDYARVWTSKNDYRLAAINE